MNNDPAQTAGSGTPEETQDELLVAYLDGQLPPDESERVESRLADEPAIRERLQSLDRVWNALDSLPRATAPTAFTRSTVEMVAQSATASVPDKKPRWRFPLVAVVAVAGLAAGAVLSLGMATAPERRALRELPLAIHADALENAGSLVFLMRLADEAAPQLAAFLTDRIAADATRWEAITRMPTPELREWIESLPSDQVGELDTRVDRFGDRLPDKREALRALADEIDRHERSDELRSVALTYQAMVGRLTAGEQAGLRQSNADERLRLIRRSAKRWSRDAAMELNSTERSAFREAIDRLVATDAFQRTTERFARRFPPMRDRVERSPELALLGATQFVGRDLLSRSREPRDFEGSFRKERSRGGARDRLNERRAEFETVVEMVGEQWQSWFDQLVPSLPARARTQFAAIQDVPQRARLFERLLRDAVREDLQDAFVELSPDEMQRALLLPRGEFTESLSGDGGDDLERFLGPPHGGPPRDGPQEGPPEGPPGRFGAGRGPGPPGGRDFRAGGFQGDGDRRRPSPRGGRPPRFSDE